MQKLFSFWTNAEAGVSATGVLVINTLLIAFLLTCAYTDTRWSKIYNKFTFPTMLLGIVLNGIFGGPQAALWALCGWGVGMAIQWVPFMLGLAKAGDVKFLAAVGALKRRPLKTHQALRSAGPLELTLQLGKPAGRRRRVGPDPAFVNFLDGNGVEVIPPLAPLAHRDHQIRFLEHLQMLHHGAAIELGEVRAKRARRQRLVAQIVEDLPPNLRAQRLEHPIVPLGN